MNCSQSKKEENTEEKKVETEDKMEVEEDKKKSDEVHYQPNKYPSSECYRNSDGCSPGGALFSAAQCRYLYKVLAVLQSS